MRRRTLLAVVVGIHAAVVAVLVVRALWRVDKVDDQRSSELRVAYVAEPGAYMELESALSELSARTTLRPDAVLHASSAPAPAARTGEANDDEVPPADDIAVPPRPLEDYASFEVPYSDEARERGAAGTIHIGLLVDATGVVREAVVLEGIGFGLDEQARALAATFRFEPARNRAGNATSARIRWSFRVKPADEAALN